MNRINFGVKLRDDTQQIRRPSEVTRQRIIVRLSDDIFNQEPPGTLNEIGFYQLKRLAELFGIGQYAQYIVRISATDKTQGERRLTLVKKFLADETDIKPALLQKIQFEMIFNLGQQSLNLWDVHKDLVDSSTVMRLSYSKESLNAFAASADSPHSLAALHAEERVQRRSSEAR